MTANDGRRETPPVGPPWSAEVLADLHAGVFDEQTTAELWPKVQADPAARSMLAVLDATRAELASLRDIPPVPMPAEIAGRIDAALTAESHLRTQSRPKDPAAVVDLTAERRRRRNRLAGWGTGLVAVAAAVTAVVFTLTPSTHTTPGRGEAAPAPSATDSSRPSLAFSSPQLGDALLGPALRLHDAGPFADKQKLTACLQANAIDPGTQVVGIGPVQLDGRAGMLMVLTTGRAAQFRLLVVGPECGARNPATLGNALVGQK